MLTMGKVYELFSTPQGRDTLQRWSRFLKLRRSNKIEDFYKNEKQLELPLNAKQEKKVRIKKKG